LKTKWSYILILTLSAFKESTASIKEKTPQLLF